MEISDWFHFGLNLGIQESMLLNIHKQGRLSSKCLSHMLKEWKKLETPTWNKVVTALVAVGRPALAKHIARKYGKMIRKIDFQVALSYQVYFFSPYRLWFPYPRKYSEQSIADDLSCYFYCHHQGIVQYWEKSARSFFLSPIFNNHGQ